MLIVAGAGLIVAAEARANGGASHLWITEEAIAQLPEGALHDFVDSADLRLMLDNGSFYPDGGYGPVNHPHARDAAETAHWEPFQDAYRLWIMDNYQAPYTGEAREHVAFYLGMAAHGMGDQVFDSMFMERSRRFDSPDLSDFDKFMDYVMVDYTGPVEPPVSWMPIDPLLDVYADGFGIDYTGDAMEAGQSGNQAAIRIVSVAGQNPASVDDAKTTYPWAAEHLLDPAAEGSPPVEAAIVARYWRVCWDLLHGRGLRRPVMYTLPYDGTGNHPTDAASIESWITIVFTRGLDADALTLGDFAVADASGAVLDVGMNLYYGQDSHVVHLQPMEDLAPDTVYTVTIEPGIETVHGEQLEGWDFTFSTGPEAPEPLHDDDDWTAPDPEGDMDMDMDTDGDATDGAGADDGRGGCRVSATSRAELPLGLALCLLGMGGAMVSGAGRRRRG